MPARRIEFTVSEETWQQIEQARGDVPRAAWVKRAIAEELHRQHTPPSKTKPSLRETWAR